MGHATKVDRLLVDTDVLIWHLAAAIRRQRVGSMSWNALTLSAVSYLEVLQGMRNKAELIAVKKMLERCGASTPSGHRTHYAAGHRADGVAYPQPRAAEG